MSDGAASDSGSATSSVELISSHLHRLQLDHNSLQHRFLQAIARIEVLEQEQASQASRLQWLEQLVQRARACFSGVLFSAGGLFPQLPRHQQVAVATPPGSSNGPATPPKGAGQSSMSHVGPKAKTLGKSWKAKMSDNRLAALVKWERIVEAHSEHFGFVAEARREPELASYSLHDVLSDIFSVKASTTLHTRSGPLLRFLKFCHDERQAPFPLRESLLYYFLKQYGAKQAPTFASSFLGSLAFCHHLLGLKCQDEFFSTRVTGAARGLFLEKRKLVQKPPLLAAFVLALENIVLGQGDFSWADRYAAGCCLFAIYARARFSDMQSCGNIFEDIAYIDGKPHGFLQADITRTKTAYTLERKTKYLAMCAPIWGLAEKPWAIAWRAIAKDHGPPCGEDLPLLPSPVESGGWQETPVSVEVGARWLRSLLHRMGLEPASAVRLLGTHSMKATVLSWAAKWGMSKEIRMILGYHSSSRSDSDVVYGRDNVAPALRELVSMLQSIAQGSFRPDATRSGMFISIPAPAESGDGDDISLSSEGSQDEENKDPAAEDEAVDSVVGLWEPSEGVRETLERAPVFRHEVTRFLHIVASEEGSHFKCGRKISASYVRCENLPKVLFPVCKQCCPDVKSEGRVIQVEQSMLRYSCECSFGNVSQGANWVDACGLPKEDAAKVKAAVGSLRQLAFISSFTPGQADEAPLMAALKSMLGRDAELAVQASFRALYHEAYAIVTSEMRQRIEKSEEPTARRLTQPERAERHEKQVAKLVGVLIKGPSEPSEALVDKAVSAYEQNELRYISWESCTSREQEVASERKKDTRFTIDEHSGKLKVENKDAEDKASAASEVHVLQALQRRSLALDQANLVEYTLMQQWSDRLLRARMDDPPPQYSRPSWSQLVAADKKLFSELRDLTRDGVQSSSGGARPLDKHLPAVIQAVMMSYDVVCLLQHSRPAGGKEGKGKGRMPAQLIAWGCTLACLCHPEVRAARARGLRVPEEEARVTVPGNDSDAQASQSLGPEHFLGGSSFEADACGQPASSSPQHDKFSTILQQCLSFFDSLPHESVGTKTESHRDQVGKAFYSGMYSKGVVGLRTSVHRHPEEVKVLTSLIRAVEPTMLFSSLVVAEDSQVGVHKDAQNVCVQNLVIPMTRFGGGELLLEDPKELFAETGNMTSALRSFGFQALPLGRRAKGPIHVTPLDLSRALSWQYVKRLVQAGDVFVVHLSPPARGSFADAVAPLVADFCCWLRSEFPSVHFSVVCPASAALWKQSGLLDLQRSCIQVSFTAADCGPGSHENFLLMSSLPELRVFETPADASKIPSGSPVRAAPVAAPSFLHTNHFCTKFASALALAAGQLDTVPTPALVTNASARAANQLQPRVSRAVVLVEEYHYQVTVPVSSQLSDLGIGKLVSITCGGYRSPLQFAERALNVGHPCDMCRALPDQAMVVLGHLLIEGPVKVLRRRLDTITQWKAWAAELEPAEAELHKSLPPSVAEVDMTSGFKIVGEEFPSGIFPLEPRPATLTPEELLAQSRSTKPLIWEQVNDAPLDANSRELFEITEAEYREKGWLEQPRSWEELELLFGDWLPAKRFGVRQRDKLRPIDDLAANGANSAFAACDKLTLRAFDELVWCATYIMRVLVQKGTVHLVLSCGRVISGPLHDFWRIKTDRARPLLKTIDLKAAYKQLPLHPEHRRFCVVALKHPDSGQVRGYASRVLPFGASGSVTCFNRVARLIQRILQEAWILNCNYFDDFPVLELSALSGSADSTAHCILDLLGFECSTDKEEPFKSSADVLGVTVDLSCEGLSEVRVRNREVKCCEVAASVDEVLDRGAIRSAEIASLFGRIQFLEGQLMGRMGRLALSELRSLGTSGGILKLGDSERHAFQNLRERLLHGPPRAISARPPGANVIVFTDGACEPEGDSMLCSIGGVLYVESSGKWATRYFGCRLPDSLVKTWSASGKKHLIGPVELYAVTTARLLWREYLDFAKGIFFIDHAGVHAACVNGSSHDRLWRLILLKLEEADAKPMIAWYARGVRLFPSLGHMLEGSSEVLHIRRALEFVW
ncbi:unnamed protein product [Symbiodinium sp. CCMP2592]|nr:unnamed protein product [Symbiodinium sp. CCMP2592]